MAAAAAGGDGAVLCTQQAGLEPSSSSSYIEVDLTYILQCEVDDMMTQICLYIFPATTFHAF